MVDRLVYKVVGEMVVMVMEVMEVEVMKVGGILL